MPQLLPTSHSWLLSLTRSRWRNACRLWMAGSTSLATCATKGRRPPSTTRRRSARTPLPASSSLLVFAQHVRMVCLCLDTTLVCAGSACNPIGGPDFLLPRAKCTLPLLSQRSQIRRRIRARPDTDGHHCLCRLSSPRPSPYSLSLSRFRPLSSKPRTRSRSRSRSLYRSRFLPLSRSLSRSRSRSRLRSRGLPASRLPPPPLPVPPACAATGGETPTLASLEAGDGSTLSRTVGTGGEGCVKLATEEAGLTPVTGGDWPLDDRSADICLRKTISSQACR